MDPVAAATLAGRGVLILLVVGAVMYACTDLKNMVAAPIKAELDASRGNQAAAKKANDTQGKSIEGLQEAGKRRQAASKVAVDKAGEPDYAAARGLLNAPPAPGATPAERAANRINAELGL